MPIDCKHSCALRPITSCWLARGQRMALRLCRLFQSHKEGLILCTLHCTLYPLTVKRCAPGIDSATVGLLQILMAPRPSTSQNRTNRPPLR